MNKSTYWLVVLTILTGTIFSGCTTAKAPTSTIEAMIISPTGQIHLSENFKGTLFT